MDENAKRELLSVSSREIRHIREGRPLGPVSGAIAYISSLYAHAIGAWPAIMNE